MALGALIGVVNGLIVTKMKVNSVIATLGVGTIITGLTFAYSTGVPIVAGVPEASCSCRSAAGSSAFPTTSSSWRWCSASLWLLVERTSLGQEIQAVGGNAAAARLAGINVDRIKILGFVISGMCAALTGILLASRLGSGTTSAADSYLLTAFAAVFLGSATLRDGEFHVLGTLVGALIIAFGFNGLNIFGAPTFSQYIFQGAILIVAVGLSSLGRILAEILIGGKQCKKRSGNSSSSSSPGPRISHGSIWSTACIDEGTTDLPFSFILARSGDRNVLIDTGFMKDDHGPNFSDKFGIPVLDLAGAHAWRVGTRPGGDHRHRRQPRAFRPHGLDRRVPQGADLSSRSRSCCPGTRRWRCRRSSASSPRSSIPTICAPPSTRCRAPADACRRRQGQRSARHPCAARPGPHARPAIHVIVETARGRLVVSGDCVYCSRNLTGHNHDGVYLPLNNAVGSVWEQLKTIDRINTEIGGDLAG